MDVTYQFRREDNDEIVELSFEQMMTQDAAGYVTLPDGVVARRVPTGNLRMRATAPQGAPKQKWTSENLGFGDHVLAEMEEDRVRNGFTGTEFVRDPDCPEFVNVEFSSQRERARYMRHRGFFERNGRKSGVTMTQADLDRAADLVNRDIKRREAKRAAATD